MCQTARKRGVVPLSFKRSEGKKGSGAGWSRYQNLPLKKKDGRAAETGKSVSCAAGGVPAETPVASIKVGDRPVYDQNGEIKRRNKIKRRTAGAAGRESAQAWITKTSIE